MDAPNQMLHSTFCARKGYFARVLKTVGRSAVGNIALKKPPPAESGQALLAYVGCVAGALPVEEYHRRLTEADCAGLARADTLSESEAPAGPMGQVNPSRRCGVEGNVRPCLSDSGQGRPC